MTTRNWQELMNEAGGGIELLPPGEYEAETVKADHKVAQSGKDMWSVRFKITTGPYANKPVWNNFTLAKENPNALGVFFRQMAIFGLDGEFFGMNPSNEQVADALGGGKKCRLTVGQREYPKGSGQMRNDVSEVKASGMGANPPVRSLTAGVAAAAPAPTPSVTPGAPAAPAPAVPGVPAPSIQTPPAPGAAPTPPF